MNAPTNSTIWMMSYDRQAQEVELAVPRGARRLAFQDHDGKPTLWYLVDPLAEREVRRFYSLPTGGKIPQGIALDYIGTIQLREPPTVLHLFEVVHCAQPKGVE